MKNGFAGVLQRSGGDSSEWQQDCLACLLKLLCQLGVSSEEGDILHEVPDNLRNKRARRFRKGSSDKLVIPKLNEVSEESVVSNQKYLEIHVVLLSCPCALQLSWDLLAIMGFLFDECAMLRGMRQGTSCMFEVIFFKRKMVVSYEICCEVCAPHDLNISAAFH
jgi:hypothetical protein